MKRRNAMHVVKGNLEKAAKILGVSRRSFSRKLREAQTQK